MRDIASPLDGFASPFGPGRRTLTNLLFGQNEPGFTFEPWDITTLYQDRAGTTPVTAAGQSVGYRRDKSGRGNHEVAINDAARGIYGWMPKTGRRNLLTYSEQFDNAAWNKTISTTVAANAMVAPDGTATADTVTSGGAAGYIYPSTAIFAAAGGATYTYSTYIKAGTATSIQLLVAATATYTGTFNLSTGVASTITPNTTVSMVDVGGGWYRCVITCAAVANTVYTEAQIGRVGLGLTFSIWGAQLELGSTATAYQRVVSNYDVTEAGVPSCYYVLANGVNTAYSTPTITPGTDKVQVFAGVRKNSDAAIGMVVEFSANVNTNNGTFWLAAPIGAGVANYDFASKGTIGRSKTRTGFAAPISSVLTGTGDVSGDASNLRVNGNDAGATTTDQGTGNYLAYPAYIYARGGTTLPFNGYDFGHVMRFGPNLDAATIARVEALIARNTPEVTL